MRSKVPSFKYGMPLFGAAWPDGNTIYVCGGGAKTSSGIKNRLVFAKYEDGVLGDQIGEVDFGEAYPVRLSLLPSGNQLLCVMGSGELKLFQLELNNSNVSEARGVLHEQPHEGQEVKCINFSTGGNFLVVGTGEGFLSVYEWPSMIPQLQRNGDDKLSDGVRDADLCCIPVASKAATAAPPAARGDPAAGSQAPADSSAAPALILVVAVSLEDGAVELWELSNKRRLSRLEQPKGQLGVVTVSGEQDGVAHTVAQQVPKGMEGPRFVRCRWTRGGGPPSLITLANNREGSHLVLWRMSSRDEQPHWRGRLSLVRCVKASMNPATCMELSPDGTMVAVGTGEGGIVVLSSPELVPLRKVDGVHMVFVTSLSWAADGHAIVSTSADASASITEVTGKIGGPMKFTWVVLLLLLVVLLLLLSLGLAAMIADDPTILDPLASTLGWKTEL